MAPQQGRQGVIRDVRTRLADLGPPRERSEGDFARVALPSEDGDALRDVLMDDHVRSVIEVGLAYGSSTLAIAEALAVHAAIATTHVVIDPHQGQFDDVGWEIVESAGLATSCTLVVQPSQLALPRMVADGVIVDAAFVDGSHLFHNVFVDLHFLRELVRPGGIIVLDDCEWASVATAVEYFVRNTGWQVLGMPRRTRLRAFRLPDPPVHPRFDTFRPFGTHGTPS